MEKDTPEKIKEEWKSLRVSKVDMIENVFYITLLPSHSVLVFRAPLNDQTFFFSKAIAWDWREKTPIKLEEQVWERPHMCSEDDSKGALALFQGRHQGWTFLLGAFCYLTNPGVRYHLFLRSPEFEFGKNVFFRKMTEDMFEYDLESKEYMPPESVTRTVVPEFPPFETLFRKK